MKKNFLIALLVAVVFSGSSFANTGKSVNALVKQSFQKEFAGAQSVSWEVISDKDICEKILLNIENNKNKVLLDLLQASYSFE